MAWDALKFEDAVIAGLKEGLSREPFFSVQEESGVATTLRPDALILSERGSHFAVEVKYFSDPRQNIHFGTIAQTAASAKAIGAQVGEPVEGIIVTNGQVPKAITDLARGVGVRIYTAEPDDMSPTLNSLISGLPGGDD